MDQSDAASCGVRLKLEEGKLTLDLCDGLGCDVSSECVEWSLLLTGLVDTTSAAKGVEIPINQDTLRIWMQHVDGLVRTDVPTKRPREAFGARSGGCSPNKAPAVSTSLPSHNFDERGADAGTESPMEPTTEAQRLCLLLSVCAPVHHSLCRRSCNRDLPRNTSKLIGGRPWLHRCPRHATYWKIQQTWCRRRTYSLMSVPNNLLPHSWRPCCSCINGEVNLASQIRCSAVPALHFSIKLPTTATQRCQHFSLAPAIGRVLRSVCGPTLPSAK